MRHQHRPLRAACLGHRPADVRGGDHGRFYQQEPEDLTYRIFKLIRIRLTIWTGRKDEMTHGDLCDPINIAEVSQHLMHF